MNAVGFELLLSRGWLRVLGAEGGERRGEERAGEGRAGEGG